MAAKDKKHPLTDSSEQPQKKARMDSPTSPPIPNNPQSNNPQFPPFPNKPPSNNPQLPPPFNRPASPPVPSPTAPMDWAPSTTSANKVPMTPPTSSSVAMPTPTIKCRTEAGGKFRYYAQDSEDVRKANAGNYFEMTTEQFVMYKNSGKRTPSNKLTDPTTMRNYVLYNGKYYEFDKNKPENRGNIVFDQSTINGSSLINRSRTDRRNSALEPYDVGHYKSKPDKSKLDVLSGKAGPGANRDHVPSGASLRLRGGDIAYDQGLVIAIPRDMHADSSSTYGSARQLNIDTVGDEKMNRMNHDSKFPALAFYRDVSEILKRTQNSDYSTKDNQFLKEPFNLTEEANRIRQAGGYRTMYRQNAKMNAPDSTRGVPPTEPAHDITVKEKNGPSVASKSPSGGTEGERIMELLTSAFRK